MAISNEKLLKAYKKKNAAIDQGVKAGDLAYEAQIADAKDAAASDLQELYLQRERQGRTNPQALKAAGITGGAAESSSVALSANYNTNRTNRMIERDRQVSQIGIQQEQARADAEIQKSANDIEMEQSRLSFETDQRDFNWQKENADRSFEASQDSMARSEAWEMVRAGVINEEIARTLGRSVAVLRQYYKNYKELK